MVKQLNKTDGPSSSGVLVSAAALGRNNSANRQLDQRVNRDVDHWLTPFESFLVVAPS
jgi:hypothetical protein